MDETTKQALNYRYGLDKPLWRQFIMYLIGDWDREGEFVCGLVCGNLGPSYVQRGRSVQDILFRFPEGQPFWDSRFGYSLRLGVFSLILATLIGVPLGLVAALAHNTWADRLISLATTLGLAVPNFVVGLLIIAAIVAVGVNSLPVAPRSWADARVWLLPALILGLGVMASAARLTRASLLEVLRHDYVRTARAKGLAERAVVSRHAVRNALIPVVTLLGPALAELIAGSCIVEIMFGFPGMGRLYTDSLTTRDYSLILGVTLLYAVLVTLINVVVDFAYGVLDPRLRVR
jgi:oligopeptide transport system permease protein